MAEKKKSIKSPVKEEKKEHSTGKEEVKHTSTHPEHTQHAHEGHTHAEHEHAEHNHATQKEHKHTEKKDDEKVEEKKDEKVKKEVVKKKFIPYVKKANKKKSDEAHNLQQLLKEKKNLPTFRGRFGKKVIRRKSIAKWDKWRKPHGIDLDKGIEHGFRPKIGYRNMASIRGVHPSGYREVKVANVNDILKINSKVDAARISATVGKRKRNEIVKKANELGVWVLN